MIESDEIPLAPLDPPQLVEVRVHGVEEENHHLQQENVNVIQNSIFLRDVINPALEVEPESYIVDYFFAIPDLDSDPM